MLERVFVVIMLQSNTVVIHKASKMKNKFLVFGNIVCCITFVYMKRVILTFESDEAFKRHLLEKAEKNKKTLSSYIRSALKKVSKYKEELV